MSATASEDQPRADVELRLPADGAFASVLRTTTAGLAARLDFTMDDIEDLRMAVGEASAMVLPEADPDTDLVARYYFGDRALTVEVEASAVDNPEPDFESFAWQVLATMAEAANATSGDGRFAVRFTVQSSLSAVAGGTAAAES